MQLLDKAEITTLYGVFCGQVNHVDSNIYVAIPHYQRPYKWTEKEITKLFEDYTRNKRMSGDSNYFMGSLVTVKEDDKDYHDIIDGQQRITTTFLLNYIRFLLIRAYGYEEILSNRTGKLNEILSRFIQSYYPCLGNKKIKEYKDIKENIGKKVDEKDEAIDDNTREIIVAEIRKMYMESLNVPESDFTDLEKYEKESYKNLFSLLEDDFLTLSYNRGKYNDNLKEALARACVVYSYTMEPQIRITHEDEAKKNDSIKTYLKAMKCIFNNVKNIVKEEGDCKGNREMCLEMINTIDRIVDSLKFCVISTCNYEDAYTLFEVLNDRALAIEDVDLVKNLLFRTYCLTDTSDDEEKKDKNIQLLDDIWGNDIFTHNIADTQSKLIQYLATCYITADTSIIFNEDAKFRISLQSHLSYEYNEKNEYSFCKIYNDIAVYKMVKIITEELGLLYNWSSIPAVKAEWLDDKSITYRALHLLYALDMKGVLAALTNHIIKYFFINNVEGNDSKVNFKDFEKYIKNLFDDRNNDMEAYIGIHKTAHSLWRASLLSDTANIPREMSKIFIEKVNKCSDKYDCMVISSEQEKKLNVQFKAWTEKWRYRQSKKADLKVRLLFIQLCKTSKDFANNQIEYAPGHFTITDFKTIQLDHLEAQKPKEEYKDEYFVPQSDADPRSNYVDCLGNIMILDGEDNNNKDNKPLFKALNYYDHMGNHWLIEEFKEMLNDSTNKYSNVIKEYRIPNEEFFNERRKRLQKYFYTILHMELSEKKAKILECVD